VLCFAAAAAKPWQQRNAVCHAQKLQNAKNRLPTCGGIVRMMSCRVTLSGSSLPMDLQAAKSNE
jgi:hypothetical protein